MIWRGIKSSIFESINCNCKINQRQNNKKKKRSALLFFFIFSKISISQ